MFAVFGVISLIISLLCILVVLVQNSKGGGLSSTFGASNISQMVGARQSAENIEKITWYLCAALMIVSFLANGFSGNSVAQKESRMKEAIENPTTAPVINNPVATPPVQ